MTRAGYVEVPEVLIRQIKQYESLCYSPLRAAIAMLPALSTIDACAKAAQDAAVRRIGGYIVPAWDEAKEEERSMARDMAVSAIRQYLKLRDLPADEELNR